MATLTATIWEQTEDEYLARIANLAFRCRPVFNYKAIGFTGLVFFRVCVYRGKYNGWYPAPRNVVFRSLGEAAEGIERWLES